MSARRRAIPVEASFPPLAGSDYLMADSDRAIGIVLDGLKGPVTVNGETYDAIMPPQSHLSDDDLANVLTFVQNSWGNSGDMITSDQIAESRSARKNSLTMR